MQSPQPLLAQLRRKQVLVCAYQAKTDTSPPPLTLSQVMEVLRLDSADCERLVQRLQGKGILEPTPDVQAVLRLTGRGERLVQRMARPGAEAKAAG